MFITMLPTYVANLVFVFIDEQNDNRNLSCHWANWEYVIQWPMGMPEK